MFTQIGRGRKTFAAHGTSATDIFKRRNPMRTKLRFDSKFHHKYIERKLTSRVSRRYGLFCAWSDPWLAWKIVFLLAFFAVLLHLLQFYLKDFAQPFSEQIKGLTSLCTFIWSFIYWLLANTLSQTLQVKKGPWNRTMWTHFSMGGHSYTM